MTVAELARLCAERILDMADRSDLIEVATPFVQGAINRALDEQTRSITEVINLESGHVSVDVGTTAKGDYTYSAKVVMPFVGADQAEAAAARERAQDELEEAESFLRTRYGRATS